jgi:hypothetical protein
MATVRCPSCERALEFEDAYRDWTVRCPHCDNEFVPGAIGADRPPPRSRPRREEPDDRDDRDDYDDDNRDLARAEALQVVAGPGMALEIIGWLGTLAAMGICALFIVLAVEMNNNPNANAGDAVVFVFMGIFVGVLGTPYSVALAIGGRKMRDLSSRGWAMTAAILGVASFSVFGICGVIQAGFGVWALVALDNPAVRAAYGLESRWRPRRRRRRRELDE